MLLPWKPSSLLCPSRHRQKQTVITWYQDQTIRVDDSLAKSHKTGSKAFLTVNPGLATVCAGSPRFDYDHFFFLYPALLNGFKLFR